MERFAGSSQGIKNQTNREDRPVKRGMKADQTRKGEREKKSFQGLVID